MDSSMTLVAGERADSNTSKAEFKFMIENFVYCQNDKGAALLSRLKSYIINCGCKHQYISLNAEDQEEIIQEIAVKILKYYSNVNENPYGWLFKVAHNEYIEKLRKIIPSNNLIEVYSDNELITISDGLYSDIYSIETIDFLDCFDEIFERVTSPDSRSEDRLLYERYVEGFTHNEIAAQLNKPSSFIAKRISSLNKAIRQLFVEIC